jgi:hypothetical protein
MPALALGVFSFLLNDWCNRGHSIGVAAVGIRNGIKPDI